MAGKYIFNEYKAQKLKIDVHRLRNKQPGKPRECSAQEAVHHILTELKLSSIFLAVYYVNKDPPEERVQLLLSEKGIRELPDDSPNIFKKSNFDRYMEKPSATSCNGKCSILDDFCYAEF